MPTLLRYDAIRHLEACTEALGLAVSSLGAAKRIEFRQQSAKYAIETGLIGTAAEQAMAACIVQALGPNAVVWPSGQYKTAGALLDEFNGLVSESTAASTFLTDGVDDPGAHRTRLLEAIRPFRLLIAARAGGLHAGRGLIHEAVVVQANHVATFLDLLAKSRRLGPYLSNIPRCLWYSRDRAVVIEDLRQNLADTGSDKAAALASVYLVLPDIPEDAPEWLGALERVTLAPKERDIVYLMDSLEAALPAALRRVGTAEGTVPVRVAPHEPSALPIAPHLLRRQFNEIRDLWHADIATANGRLDQGAIDLPPIGAVVDVFALGLESAGVVAEGEQLSAHQAWPHIVASTAFSGTPGPYWFLVRRCNDLGQLSALLRRVIEIRSSLAVKLEQCLHGIDVIRCGRHLLEDDPLFRELIEQSAGAAHDRAWLLDREREFRGRSRQLPDELVPTLQAVVDGGESVAVLILALISSGVQHESIAYWTRTLAELAGEADDGPALVALLGTPEALAAHTAARKAIRRIDFAVYGPALNEN